MALARGAPLQQFVMRGRGPARLVLPELLDSYSLNVHATGPGLRTSLSLISQSHVWDLFMFVHTLHNVGGPDTSSAVALVLVP